jgi:phosphopantetheinyl transferase (holo-ACP synthase)
MTFAIGNDVVDFDKAKADSNWQRAGYLSKIFTDNEQILINKSENQEIAVWQLWSQKEAVYKLVRQLGAKRGFYPKKIIGNLNHFNRQQIQYEGKFYYCQTIIFETHLHTIALENPIHFEGIKEVTSDIIIEKIGDFPYIKTTENQQIPISKSHHGAFEYRVGIF